jgi:hypothetical protein
MVGVRTKAITPRITDNFFSWCSCGEENKEDAGV